VSDGMCEVWWQDTGDPDDTDLRKDDPDKKV
jgi:hypothetical protein